MRRKVHKFTIQAALAGLYITLGSIFAEVWFWAVFTALMLISSTVLWSWPYIPWARISPFIIISTKQYNADRSTREGLEQEVEELKKQGEFERVIRDGLDIQIEGLETQIKGLKRRQNP